MRLQSRYCTRQSIKLTMMIYFMATTLIPLPSHRRNLASCLTLTRWTKALHTIPSPVEGRENNLSGKPRFMANLGPENKKLIFEDHRHWCMPYERRGIRRDVLFDEGVQIKSLLVVGGEKAKFTCQQIWHWMTCSGGWANLMMHPSLGEDDKKKQRNGVWHARSMFAYALRSAERAFGSNWKYTW